MKKKISALFVLGFLSLFIFAPAGYLLAGPAGAGTSPPTGGATPAGTAPPVVPSGSGSGARGGGGGIIRNPLGVTTGINSIPDLIKKILQIVMEIAIPLSALSIIYSGFLFVTAAGKPDQITKARNALIAASIGTAVILGAYVIVNAISSTVTGLVGI